MPIKVPDHLPAGKLLEAEGLFLIQEQIADRQDIRPLNIALLNLMPLKQSTEIQLARLIGATPLQINLTLLTTSSYIPGNVSAQHLNSFYQSWADVRTQKFDGLIITGAPIETLPFETVKYWDELSQILDWTQSHVHRSLDICWGAQAALYHFHKIPKHKLADKAFGVYPHQIHHSTNPILRGFSDEIRIPVSRHTETSAQDIYGKDDLVTLIDSAHTGLCLIEDKSHRHLYMLNHLEYDATTLGDEYQRDLAAGQNPILPYGYYPDDKATNPPPNVWRSHAHLLFSNWINQIYQSVPFDRNLIGTCA
ncbi:MAG: homoserine O-succinyltransferase [Alphaproteobacteria bacterium]